MYAPNEYYTTRIDNATVTGGSAGVDARAEMGSWPAHAEVGKVTHILEWVRIEEFVESAWRGVGRPPHDRGALASAFVAKVVLPGDEPPHISPPGADGGPVAALARVAAARGIGTCADAATRQCVESYCRNEGKMMI